MIDLAFRSGAPAGLPQRHATQSHRDALPKARMVLHGFIVVLVAIFFVGCAASPKHAALKTPADVALDPSSLQLVGQLARVWGTKSQRVDGVSLVVGLPGTGSDPPPTSERESLLAEMQTRDVDKPNSVLASSTTALVRVRGLIPPGARKGDHFDLYVEVPKETETTSIAGGWIMATRLREYAVLGNRVAEGHLLALGQGDVLTEALLEAGDDDVRMTRGRVLGGGVVTKLRGFGLVIRDEFTSVKTSARIGDVINRRFSVYHNGSKQGVANPTRDNFLELLIHPRYVANVPRYLHVIQNIAVRESPRIRSARLDDLRLKLADPSTASWAAVQLEAIGGDGVPTLRDALDSTNDEIRFYAAEALAYQDISDGVDALDVAIRREPAFRQRALIALGAMDDVAAHEALVELLNVASAEARYGAFRILRRRTPDDPLIAGVVVNDNFSLHQVSTSGPPLIHISRIDRPEIVLFGSDHELVDPVVVFAGNEIVVRNNQSAGLTVSRLTAGEEDESAECSHRVSDVIRTIAQLDGKYADIVQALTETRRTGCLKSRLEFSAIPPASRQYQRITPTDDSQQESDLMDQSPVDQQQPGPVDLASESNQSGPAKPYPSDLEIEVAAQSKVISQPNLRTAEDSEVATGTRSQGPDHAATASNSTGRSSHTRSAGARAPINIPANTTLPPIVSAAETRAFPIPNLTAAKLPSSALSDANRARHSNPESLSTSAVTPQRTVYEGAVLSSIEPINLAAQVAAELRRAPKALPPNMPTRLGAPSIGKGEVAPSPPEIGPVLEFDELFDPASLPE